MTSLNLVDPNTTQDGLPYMEGLRVTSPGYHKRGVFGTVGPVRHGWANVTFDDGAQILLDGTRVEGGCVR